MEMVKPSKQSARKTPPQKSVQEPKHKANGLNQQSNHFAKGDEPSQIGDQIEIHGSEPIAIKGQLQVDDDEEDKGTDIDHQTKGQEIQRFHEEGRDYKNR